MSSAGSGGPGRPDRRQAERHRAPISERPAERRLGDRQRTWVGRSGQLSTRLLIHGPSIRGGSTLLRGMAIMGANRVCRRGPWRRSCGSRVTRPPMTAGLTGPLGRWPRSSGSARTMTAAGRQSKDGVRGRRPRRSSPPASPMLGPRASTASSSRGSACGFCNPANGHRQMRFHCTGNIGQQQGHQNHCHVKLEELS